MNIVFIDSSIMIPPTGGAHTFLVDICDSLVRLGHRVSVVTQPGPEQSITRVLTDSGTEVLTTVWRAWHLPDERGRALAAWVNSERPDVYVVSVSPDAGWVALPLLDSSIATISIAHNDVGAFYEPLKHYQPFIDCAVGVSEKTYETIIQDCSVPTDQAKHIPYGVRPALAGEISKMRETPTPSLKIGYVGRIVQEQKRVMDFVPLVSELAKRQLPFELVLIGDGPERSALRNAFEDRGLSRHVRFAGWLSNATVEEELRKLDVFVLLSDYEGLPVALLEAMAHGLAPVVTRTESGNTQLVRDGDNGFIVEVGDTIAICDRLESLARNREKLTSIGRAAWQTSQQYSLERMATSYVETFEQTVERVSARRQREGVTSHYPVMRSCRSKYPFWMRKLKRIVLSLGQPHAASVPATRSSSN